MSRLFLMCVGLPAATLGNLRVAGADDPVAPNSVQPAPESPPAAVAPSPVPAPAPAPSAGPASRAVSQELAARIASVAYQPVAHKPNIAPGTDLREIDKPRNTIIRLPNFEVKERKPATIKPHQVRTPQERLDLALKAHPGLLVGSFWIFRNDGVALAMQAEEQRLERMRDMSDLVGLLPASQQGPARRAVDEAFARRDFGR